MADVVRSLRPGGPQDIYEYSSHCTKCGQKMVGTLRQIGDGRCSCGGEIDCTDMRIWFDALRSSDWKTVRSIKSIRRVDGHTGDET